MTDERKNEIRSNTLEDIYQDIYYAGMLMQSLLECYLEKDADSFYKDKYAQMDFVRNYEIIAALAYLASQPLYKARLKSEIALNLRTPIVEAREKNLTEELRSIKEATA